MANLTRNFSEKELACPCCGVCKMDMKLLTRLQALRDILGPLIVVSGFRCPKHNKSLNGASVRSQHLLGRAVDIRVKNLDAKTRHDLLKASFFLNFKGIGIGKKQLHLDIREGDMSSWGY